MALQAIVVSLKLFSKFRSEPGPCLVLGFPSVTLVPPLAPPVPGQGDNTGAGKLARLRTDTVPGEPQLLPEVGRIVLLGGRLGLGVQRLLGLTQGLG